MKRKKTKARRKLGMLERIGKQLDGHLASLEQDWRDAMDAHDELIVNIAALDGPMSHEQAATLLARVEGHRTDAAALWLLPQHRDEWTAKLDLIERAIRDHMQPGGVN